ncbi:GntR family transcriptional regulator [Falsiroseomonas tokyonensis]|uniref:GntR family transcriptional regulator n=1 Tax=Falsiroseomonas tokyonensis TaxID=430521 RepID=A0ABV7BVB3_9PROT|nr:GntR family transcriptional regulator [Falsiroseomonas tokyonensis]MBU8539594.1 GntR family transcriptional regulator [Falsiroseomonas tokyonensis]
MDHAISTEAVALTRAASRPDTPRPPLYAQIEGQLREAIAEGRYAIGTLLPTEAELCESLQVSRHTIREALRRLVEAGLVERRQGAGTMVVAREAPSGTVQSLRSIESLFQYAADTRLEIRDRRMAPLTSEDAAAIPAQPGETWLQLEGLRIGQDGNPIATAEILIHPRFASISSALSERGAIYALIESRFGVEVAEVVQEITAAALPARVAEALGRKRREVGMRFVRRYLGTDGATLLLSRSWHPAERFTYAMRLRRGEG